MNTPINLEILDLFGAKAFVAVMTHGQDSLAEITRDIMALAYTNLDKNKDTANNGLHFRPMYDKAALCTSGERLLLKGLHDSGAPGMKLAARAVYASVFASMGLSTTGLFKEGIADSNEKAKTVETDTEKSVSEKIYNVIVDLLGVERSSITPASRFLQDLGADSLDLVELIMCVEDALAIELSDEDADCIHTVQDAIDMCLRTIATRN